MRVLSVKAQNFGSYKELNFEFNTEGLSLIQGPTGAGKSTLCDVIPWILFGKTAKGGAVDEIRSWTNPYPTKGISIIEFSDGSIGSINRIRGNTKDNDLFYSTSGFPMVRGRDLSDTQKLINNLLGMDYELYLASAYYHEFNQTAQFFTTTAKNRRQICEQLVDLSLPIKLKDKIKEKDRDLYQTLTMIKSEISTLESNITLLKRLQDTENNKSEVWEVSRSNRLYDAEKQYNFFESNRKRIISKKCNSCGTVLQKPREVVDESENPWLDVLERVGSEQNPHSGATKDYNQEVQQKGYDVLVLNHNLNRVTKELSELEQLSDIIDIFRSASIANTISFVETKTNQLLIDFFDAEIRVKFEVESADKLEVSIYKDGNTASFTQLSKGQRQLLKLSFGLSVMETVENHHGISVSQVFIDEATEGLDENMKLKAVRMLEKLAQNKSVYLVEHSEMIKAMIDSKYSVSLENGESQIAKA